MRTSWASSLVRAAAFSSFFFPFFLPVAPAGAEMAWNALPPMSTPRNVFTLTPLEDGRLLAAGGWIGAELASCEVYDPLTRTWSPTGSLASTRVRHSAVRLPDGRVLVAGGSTNSVGSKVVEIYDPATGSWSLAAPRVRSSSTVLLALLADGRVFLVGDFSTVAEVYDPSADAWSDTSSFGTSRSNATATVLPDGRVLLAGGYSSSAPPQGGLVYDPQADTWTPAGPFVTPRWMHTATLLADGRVLAVGGRSVVSPGVSLATAEIYDPATNAWTAAAAMGTTRINHTATLLPDGGVVVAGGQQYNGSAYSGAMASAEVYDPVTETFSPLPSLGQARYGHRGALLPSGEPMVVGGYASPNYLASAEVLAEAIDDLEPPTVAITSPVNGAAVSGTVTLAAEAADDTGVVSVSFFAGSLLLGVDATPPYELLWDTSLTYGGPRTLKAQARDLANKTADSAPVSVTVRDVIPPAVALLSPLPGSTVEDPFLMEADASDVSGVSRVDFLVDGALVGSDDSWPWQAKLSASRFSPGVHTAEARATDYQNNTGASGAVSFTVPSAGSGAATFDAGLGVPACSGGSECDSGELLVGRGPVGPEPNAPNTLGGTCPDGYAGGFHSDESIDRLRIRSLDGSPLDAGRTVEVSATVWAFSSGDFLDVYYAPDAAAPQWTLMATVQAPSAGAHVLTASFVLSPGGERQVVRGVFRYGYQPHPTEPACGAGPWDDNDDLAFSFGPGGASSPGWDAYFQTPACLGFGASCDSGALLVGRGSLGPEPNQPNTSFGECPDGNWGEFHVQPSIDRIRVLSADAGPLRRYEPARIEVTVFASSGYANERLDLFEAVDGGPPVFWQPLGSVTPTAPGLQVLTLDYTPTDGALTRAIRAAYRSGYVPPQYSCWPDVFDDTDDLWFRIDGYPGSHALVVDGTSVDGASGSVQVSYSGGGWAGSCFTGPGGPRSCEMELYDSADVTLVAQAEPGFSFAGWSGACSGTGPCMLSMSEARRVGARFEKAATPFTVVVAGANGATGFVDAFADDPALPALHCEYPLGPGPTTCEATYPVGTPVQLYAMAGPDSVFLGWSGGCSGTDPWCSVAHADGLVVEAQFDGPRPLTVQVDGVNGARGAVDAWPGAGPWPPVHCVYPGGAPGPVTCEGTYPLGTVVFLYAMPEPDSVFLGWSGACSGPQPWCEVSITDALLVQAVFDGPRPLTVQVDGANGARGAVDAWPADGAWPPVHCAYPGGVPGPVACSGTFPLGTTVHLYAMPEPDSVFLGWSGACSGPQPWCEVVITDALLVQAVFDGPRALTVQVDGAPGARGMVDAWPDGGQWPPVHCEYPGGAPGPVDCSGTFPLGTLVRLYAMAEPGSVFAGWGGACGGAEPSCDVTIDAAMLVTATFASAAQPVVWTNRIGVSESGGVLTKTAYSAWGNAGASSRQLLYEGAGSVAFTATETTTNRMVGLDDGYDSSQTYSEIDYAINLNTGGRLQVYERGSFKASFAPYSPGDTFQVSVVPGVVPQVQYARNGVVFYTSTLVPTWPLMVDCALYTQGATLADVAVSGGWKTPERPAGQPVAWTNAAGVEVSGASLTKTATTGWGNAGAVSTRWLWSGEGSVTFVATETNRQRMVGLSDITDSSLSYTDIDHAIHLGPDARVRVYEKGTYRGTFGAYAPGDWLQVAVGPGTSGSEVRYSRNGVVFYTSSLAPSHPLMVDSALYNQGATLTDVSLTGEWQ